MLLMVAATVFVIILHAAIRHVSARIPAPETAFFRAFFALVLLSPWFLRVGLAPLKTKRIGLHALVTIHK